MAVYTDIPRFYTALAEWMMCVLYIYLFPQKRSRWGTVLICISGFVVQSFYLMITRDAVIYLWLPVMFGAIGMMYIWICLCMNGSFLLAGYNCAKAFLIAEFAASLEWQLHCFFRKITGVDLIWMNLFLLIAVYGMVLLVVYKVERGMQFYEFCTHITGRETTAVAAIAAFAFIFSNMSFVVTNSPFSAEAVSDIFYIRTLGDLCGLIVLYAYQTKICENLVEKELAAIQSMYKKQYDQYRYYQNSMEIIHIKYHDLKHQIMGLRGERDEKKREAWLDHLEQELDENRLLHQTGNPVLDTILAAKMFQAQKCKIRITCVADGKLLDSMHVADICTIFGNALDNAIESVVTLEDPKTRLIHLTVTRQKGFVLIHVLNYVSESIVLKEGELPQTTKYDKENHGYGLKSIQATVRKYHGSVSVQIREHWFELRILIPEIR